MAYEGPIQELIDQLARLPGVGPKSAQRLAFWLVKADAEDAKRLAAAIIQAKERITFCRECGNVAEGDLCRICRDESRDRTLLWLLVVHRRNRRWGHHPVRRPVHAGVTLLGRSHRRSRREREGLRRVSGHRLAAVHRSIQLLRRPERLDVPVGLRAVGTRDVDAVGVLVLHGCDLPVCQRFVPECYFRLAQAVIPRTPPRPRARSTTSAYGSSCPLRRRRGTAGRRREEGSTRHDRGHGAPRPVPSAF